MPYYFKPIVWNTLGYLKPSGVKFNSGFPKDNGFGHEEWNNSPKLSFTEGPDRFKAFHAESLHDARDAVDGQITLMLIASHGGAQYLVTVASGCISLHADRDRRARQRLIERLDLDSNEMAEETWALPRVREAFADDRKRFDRDWEKDFHWIPNWICPSDLYIALSVPIKLDPIKLTGRKRLITMFSAHQQVDRDIFLKVLLNIPDDANNSAVNRLRDSAVDGSEDAVEDIELLSQESPTVRAALIQARLGQGGFRADLMARWGGACAVTGCEIGEILRASHIKPWKSSSNEERLNPENGLMLTAHLDALFDRGLISFNDDGSMLISSKIKANVASVWGVGKPLLRKPSSTMAAFLGHHRERRFEVS